MKLVSNIGAKVETPKGAAILLAADAELRALGTLVRDGDASRLFKQACFKFLHDWCKTFDDLGKGQRELSGADGRRVIAIRNEGRAWRGDLEKQQKAGFPQALEDMGAWEAGVRDLDELGAIIYTPGVIKAELDSVNTAASQLDIDINAADVREEFKRAWRAFFGEWRAFHKDNAGFWSRMWGATMEKAVEYRQRVDQWRQAFLQEGGRSSSPTLSLPQESPDSSWKWMVLGAGSLVLTGALVGRAVSR